MEAATMRALRLMGWKSEPELVEVDEPKPGPGEVVVKVGGAGACHSDLHLMHDFEASALPWGPPFTLGHETAGLTPYHAIRRSWPKLAPGTHAVVIGVGGLGHVGVQILRATTATRVIAVDTRAEALRLAEECGADLVVRSADKAAEQIRRATGGRGADVVLDFVGTEGTLALAAAIVRTMGDLTIVGIGGGTLPVSFFSVPYEASIQTTYWGSRPELVEILD